MKEYHKIYTLWERDPETKFKTLKEGCWAKPEFAFLADCPWRWDEKIDGTNIRVMWDGEKVSFGGKTDNAQLFAPLYDLLQAKFYAGAMSQVFKGPVCLYGEGYGAKIQKGGENYKADGVDFLAFDICAGETWLTREQVRDLCGQLEVDVVPEIGSGSLDSAIGLVQAGFQSVFGPFHAEGLVVRPMVELKDRQGHRVIGKIKCKDF